MLFFDTCALLDLQDIAFNSKFTISSRTLLEIESIKNSKNKDIDIKLKARNISRLLNDKHESYSVVVETNEIIELVESNRLPLTSDNIIVASASTIHDCLFVTGDILCSIIAKDIFRIKTIDVLSFYNFPAYFGDGYLNVYMSDDDLSEFYKNIGCNKFGCCINEYIILRNLNGEVIDKYKWNGSMFEPISYRVINNDFFGKVRPRNIQQELAFDLLQDYRTPVKVIVGKFGTGKDYLMISHAIDMVLKKQKYKKIIWIRNNIEVKDSKPIGFIPGDITDKVRPFANIIADHVGGQSGLDALIAQDKLELQHLGFIRGRDIKDSIVLCSEAENLTKEHMQLLISRIGEDSSLWLNGDFKQVDDQLYLSNSGLMTAIKKLNGNKNFGFVKLEKTERSEVAEMADLLD